MMGHTIRFHPTFFDVGRRPIQVGSRVLAGFMCVHTGITEIWEWVSHGSRLDGDGVGERCSKLLVRIAYGISFFLFLFTIPKFCRCLDRPGWSRQSQPRCSRHRPRACGFCVVRMARSFSGEVGAARTYCVYTYILTLYSYLFSFLLFYTYLLTKILLFFLFTSFRHFM